ncbi:MAG: PilN domain-containing protein [Syntrophales bacterium]|nr:PilN domain-containing protein [Syntrophales bacterium]
MNWKPGSWWETISAALLTEASNLGVYLEKSGLTLAQVHKGFSGIQVTHLESLSRGEDVLASLEPQIQELISSWDLANCPVNLAVSRDLCFFREVKLPLAAAENLAQVVSYELDRFLPLPAPNLFYDYQVLKETESGIHLMLLALPREPVEQCLELLTRAGLKPYSVEPGPVAVANAFTLLGGKPPASWLLIQEEQGEIELTHILGRTLGFSRPLRPKPRQRLGEALEAEIRHLEEAGNPPQALGLYGQIAAAPEITALARQENLAVITPDSFNIPGLAPEKDLETVALAAVGAALRGSSKVPVGTNLLPPEERSAVTSSGFSLKRVLLLVFVALLFLYPVNLLVHKRIQLYQVDRELAQITPGFRQVEKQLNEVRRLAQQMQNLRRLEKSPNKLNVIKDLTQIIPKHTWLFNLRISQQNLEMGGMSRSAADLIPLLEKSGWLTKTEFASPIVTDANKLEHFKIKAEIKGLELGP